jgi:anti-sigma factor RsiW
MKCDDVRELLGAHVDDELASDVRREVDAHLADCADCAREREAIVALNERIRVADAAFEAPDVLVARVRAAAAALPEGEASAAPVRTRRAAVFGFVGGLVAAGLAFMAWHGVNIGGATQDELLAAHLASLRGRLTDVVSNDQHNVKPWFNGRVDLSPPVPDLSDAGFTLIGGRIDTVAHRGVAVVVYGIRKHLINVFVWPVQGTSAAPAPEAVRNGYHFVRWRSDGLEQWAVSDLNASELGAFVTAYTAR